MVTLLAKWQALEPVRTYLYPVVVAALVLLNAYGIMTEEKAALWGNLAALVLVGGIEKARGRVKPVYGSTWDGPGDHRVQGEHRADA